MNSKIEHFALVEKAIRFILGNPKQLLDVNVLAQELGLSGDELDAVFMAWASIPVAKFIQFSRLNFSKPQNETPSLFQTEIPNQTLSTSLHVNMEAMSEEECANGCSNLKIFYQVASGFLGQYLVACTAKGICFLHFGDSETTLLEVLKSNFSKASLHNQNYPFLDEVHSAFGDRFNAAGTFSLHIKGSAFQLDVWQALLTIPLGTRKTYGQLAQELGNPAASRAVGTAIGSNPIAVLIPCHRVVRESGALGGYRWGLERKHALLCLEAFQTNAWLDL